MSSVMRLLRAGTGVLSFSPVLMGTAHAASSQDILEHLILPAGFRIEIYVDDVPGARSLALGDRGTVFAGTQNAGSVYAVRRLADGRRRTSTVAEGLDNRSEATPPARKLDAHVAPLGVKFYTGKQFPASYRDQLLIAEHGSWNRTQRSGYRITLVRLEGARAVSYEPFVTGWNQPTTVLGRPVDLLVMPDGAVLVSDDQAGVIYRISYRGAD